MAPSVKNFDDSGESHFIVLVSSWSSHYLHISNTLCYHAKTKHTFCRVEVNSETVNKIYEYACKTSSF
jgi:hypothetical protein